MRGRLWADCTMAADRFWAAIALRCSLWSMIPAKAVGASSNHQTVCTGSAALFEHGLKLGHGSVAWQAAEFAQRAGSAGLAVAAGCFRQLV